MRSPTLAFGLSVFLTFGMLEPVCPAIVQDQSGTSTQNPGPLPASPSANSQQQQNVTETAKTPAPGQFVLQDGTAIKLRFNRNVSSADATVGESVDLEVLEEIVVNGITVVPKEGSAIATVTEAVPKRRMGRAGKLEIVLDYVRLADNEKVPVRAIKEAKGGSHVGGMTVGIVATSLVFFPAAPLFLLMHGHDITIPKGSEVTAYVNGDLKLTSARFTSPVENGPGISPPAIPSSALGSVEVHSNPDSAEVYADGMLIGDTPATLKLNPGQHTIRVTLAGYKEWTRDLSVQTGSEAHLTANLEKQQ